MFGQPQTGGIFGGGLGQPGLGQPQIRDPNTNQSAVVPEPPGDAVSSLAWSPAANILAAGSWDKSVRVWEVTQTGIAPRMAMQHEAPVLCCGFSRDGQRLVSGGCDNK